MFREYNPRMMKRWVVLEKRVGETPLAALRVWQAAHLEYANEPASYAGRLDPMASGKLLVLLGDECKQQKKYTGLDKEYEIEVLLDVGSDTGDVLGLAAYEHEKTIPDEKELRTVLEKEVGAHERAYPAFSSKVVDGKPLFLHALEGALSKIKIPTHIESVYRIKYKGAHALTNFELEKRVTDLLKLVPRTDEPSKRLGEDFRINAVRESWEKVFAEARNRTFVVLKLSVTCASGTYMRSLAPRIGEALGTRALALSIHRTKIGKYQTLFSNFGFWSRLYR